MKEERLKASKLLQQKSGVNFACHTEFSISTRAHCHDFMELFIIGQGKIGHSVNGAEQRLEKDSLVFIRPDDVHYYFSLNSGCELINLAFPLEFFEEMKKFSRLEMQLEKLLKGPCKSIRLSTLLASEAINKMRSAEHKQLTEPELARAQFKSLIFGIFTNILLETKVDNAVTVPQWLEEVCQEMKKEKNYIKGLPAMKKLANCSQEHLCRIFRKYLNKTPIAFINELRLEAAAARLRSSDEKMHCIAMDNGFENLSHFYHMFNKQFGLSPAKYRKEFLQSAIPM